MKLGAFSVSLSVRDLAASKKFYQTLGFAVFHGEEAQNWLLMKNGDHIVGLFQGMFEGNMLTFNPGWDQNGQAVNPFTDVRALQKHLKAEGVALDTQCDETGTGAASFTLRDPDGNAILIDQHR